jgi:hypothetical protein
MMRRRRPMPDITLPDPGDELWNLNPAIEEINDFVDDHIRVTTGIAWFSGAGSPEGVVAAPVGSLYSDTEGGEDSTLYVKESGTGNTGWTAK